MIVALLNALIECVFLPYNLHKSLNNEHNNKHRFGKIGGEETVCWSSVLLMLTQPIAVCFANLMTSCTMSKTLPGSFIKDLFVMCVLAVVICFCLLMPI